MIETGKDTDVSNGLVKSFRERFASAPRVFRAPGRVNLIGEHTDYNDGFVLPAAIDLYTWTAVTPRTDRKLIVFSQNLNEVGEIDLSRQTAVALDHWLDYIHGVAVMLEKRGIPVP